MEFIITKEQFEPLLNSLQPFLDKKDSSSITAHIFLETQENKLILHATDYEIGLKINFDQLNIISNGKTTVNGKKILDIIKSLKTGEIRIKKDEHNLSISQGKSHFELPTFIADEFPEEPTFEASNQLNVSIKELSQNFKKIIPLVETTSQKIELTGIHLNFKNKKLETVGTDTKRLAVISIDYPSNAEIKFIIPKKIVLEVQKIEFFDSEAHIFHNASSIIITDKQYFFYGKLINGQYPEYQQIIPQQLPNSLELPRDPFLESIKLINSLSNEVKIEIHKNEIIFSSINSGADEKAQTSIEFDGHLDEKIILALHSKHFLDFLVHTQTTHFTLSFRDFTSPFLLKSENLITIIMPILL